MIGLTERIVAWIRGPGPSPATEIVLQKRGVPASGSVIRCCRRFGRTAAGTAGSRAMFDLSRSDAKGLGFASIALARLTDHYRRYVDDGRLPFFQLAVIRHGRLAHYAPPRPQRPRDRPRRRR